MRDRFGAVLTASISVLCVEAAIGVLALVVWGRVREHPEPLPFNGLAILAVPLIAAAGAVLGTLVSVGAVMPLLDAAGWFGRRLSGRQARWWVPALAAAGTAPCAMAAVVFTETSLLAAFDGWLMVTAALAAAALVARRLLLPDRPWLSGAAMFGRVALYGTLTVVTAGTLAGIGLHAGLGYAPPRLSTDRVAGTWSDGKGGTLVLTADGKSTATRVHTYDVDGSLVPCSGTGSWVYHAGAGVWSQEVDVSIVGCSMDTWKILGTSEHPKLYVFIGDPDSWDLYTLQRRDLFRSPALRPGAAGQFTHQPYMDVR